MLVPKQESYCCSFQSSRLKCVAKDVKQSCIVYNFRFTLSTDPCEVLSVHEQEEQTENRAPLSVPHTLPWPRPWTH